MMVKERPMIFAEICALAALKKGVSKVTPSIVNFLFLDEFYRKDAIQSTGEK